MFIFDWFWGVLTALGLYSKNAKIIFLGLDNAGKTTLLHMLRDDKLSAHYPTQKPTMEELNMGNIKFRTYDLGGHLNARKIWRDYFPEVNAVVYLVDASDRSRFAESKEELDALLETDELKTIPFLVFGNKIDLPEAVSPDELREALGLQPSYGFTNNKDGNRPIELFMTSIANRSGYKEGFNWLSGFI